MASMIPHEQSLTTWINEELRQAEPITIVAVASGISVIATMLYYQMTDKISPTKKIKKFVFSLVQRVPYVQKKLEMESNKVKSMIEKDLLEACGELQNVLKIPDQGWSRETVLKNSKSYLQIRQEQWKKGFQSGTVYNGCEELTSVLTEVYGMAAWTNPLHPDAFPGLRKMEAEIVQMCCDLFSGSSEACGSVTSGGTESIILACKAYRNYAREIRGIKNPTIVVPVTAHAAFDKAADLLDIEIVHVPVNPVSQLVDLRAMKKAITRSTCMLVGSAPNFPSGGIDDIVGIAELGRRNEIPVHVDACLGGFLIAFMKQAGYPVKPFDFSVPGVTSISSDTHKYGYAPKGTSVLMFSEPKYRHRQWCIYPDWPGGIYATSCLSGSRPGGLIAACWATLTYFGKQGYVKATREIIETTRFIEKELRSIDGIYIVGSPDVSIIAIGSSLFNIFGLHDLLKKKQWSLNDLQFPDAIHLCVTLLHTNPGVAEKFIADVKECVHLCLEDPESCNNGSAALYGMTQSIPDRSLVERIAWSYLDALYVTSK